MSVVIWLRRCGEMGAVPRGMGPPTPLTIELPAPREEGDGSGQGECWTKRVMKSLSKSFHFPFRAHIGLHEEARARTLCAVWRDTALGGGGFRVAPSADFLSSRNSPTSKIFIPILPIT